VRFLVDTNVFLEVLLEQAKADEARSFLANPNAHDLLISDYAVHSIGLLLLRRNQADVFRQFLSDTSDAGVTMASLTLLEMDAVADASVSYSLDFDDAYQYVTAGKYGLTIVTFDSDFDRTPRGRTTPSQAS
jgi:hypothetical protein